MPEQPDEGVLGTPASDEGTAAGAESDDAAQSFGTEPEAESRDAAPQDAVNTDGSDAGTATVTHSSLPAPHEDDADEAKRKARIEAAKRRYRATLRNEADSGGGGFSKEYYRSQKPPHWG